MQYNFNSQRKELVAVVRPVNQGGHHTNSARFASLVDYCIAKGGSEKTKVDIKSKIEIFAKSIDRELKTKSTAGGKKAQEDGALH